MKCNHIKSDGKQCNQRAGFRTFHPGRGKCRDHDDTIILHESNKLLGGACYCKSKYEKNALERMDFDSNVVTYTYEPYRIEYNCMGQDSYYTPDILVEYSDGKKELIEVKSIVEMENAEALKLNSAKFKAADEHAKSKGIEFNIWVYRHTTLYFWSYTEFCLKTGKK